MLKFKEHKSIKLPKFDSYDFFGKALPIMFILGIILVLLAISIIKVSNEQTYEVTVQSKEVKNESNGDGKYLVFTIDNTTGESRVFEVTDSLWKWRFDSSDVYNTIIPEHTYKFTTGGYRVPLFSWYQNIYEVTEIEEN